jgi:regulator of protease activity HflC (stomatin/prohibitin superfamily)
MTAALPNRTAPQDEELGFPTGNAWAQSIKLSFRFLFVAAAAAAIGWAVSNIRQIPFDSQAIIYRFGAVVRVQGAGLVLAWPQPIEEVLVVPSPARQIPLRISKMDSPLEQSGTDSPASSDANDATANSVSGIDVSGDPRANAGLLLTGDDSLVHIEATVFYQVSDPVDYAIAVDHVEAALQRLFMASAVKVAAGRDLDTILVARPELGAADALTGREALRADLLSATNRRLVDLASAGADLGITVTRVDLAAAIPAGAKMVFDSVLVAAQNADGEIAAARASAERIGQNANQDSDQATRAAQAAANEQINLAKQQTAEISALAGRAQGVSGQMLLDQIYNERIAGVLARAFSVQTIDPKGAGHFILPAASAK